MIIYRSQCCCYLTVVLATTSMDVRYTDTQTQTWRKWTTIWREKQYVLSENTCYFGEHGWFISLVGSLNLHHCIISFPSLPFFCLKESLCGQRGLLPNTDIQTFQVSLTSHLRSHYDRIREPFIRVHPALFVKIIEKNHCQQQWFQFLTFTGCLLPFSPEKWAIAADGCRLH